MTLHVLGHIEPGQGGLVIEEKPGDSLRQERLADTGRSEKDERADGTLRVLEAGPRAPHGIGDGVDCRVLTDHSPVQHLLHPQEPPALPLHQAIDRNTGPLGDHLGDTIGLQKLLEQPAIRLRGFHRRLRFRQLLLQGGQLAVLQPGRAVIVQRPLRLLDLDVQRVNALSDRRNLLQPLLFLSPAQVETPRALLHRGQLTL